MKLGIIFSLTVLGIANLVAGCGSTITRDAFRDDDDRAGGTGAGGQLAGTSEGDRGGDSDAGDGTPGTGASGAGLPEPPGSGGGIDEGGSGAGFLPAKHAALPNYSEQGGPVLAHPTMVTITFANDPFATEAQAYADWLVSSNWMAEVGTQYGISGATHAAPVQLDVDAPANISDEEIQTWLVDQVSSGMLPAPGTLTDPIYFVYLPAETTATLGEGGLMSSSCADFGGYHLATDAGNPKIVYAVIPRCEFQGASADETREHTVSHEFIEAATNPFPFTNPGITTDYNSTWSLVGAEVADPCGSMHIDTRTVTRVWSNQEAALGNDPCIPSVGEPYFSVSTESDEWIVVQPGQSKSLEVTGWSTAPRSDWALYVYSTGTVEAEAYVDDSAINNGLTTTLHMQMPPSAQSGDYSGVMIVSYDDDDGYQTWPVGLYVP